MGVEAIGRLGSVRCTATSRPQGPDWPVSADDLLSPGGHCLESLFWRTIPRSGYPSQSSLILAACIYVAKDGKETDQDV